MAVGITALHDCTLRPSVSSTGRWIYHLTHTLDRIFSLFILADNSWGTGPAGMGVVLLGEKCFLVQQLLWRLEKGPWNLKEISSALGTLRPWNLLYLHSMP